MWMHLNKMQYPANLVASVLLSQKASVVEFSGRAVALSVANSFPTSICA
jgi:hypothetical protein